MSAERAATRPAPGLLRAALAAALAGDRPDPVVADERTSRTAAGLRSDAHAAAAVLTDVLGRDGGRVGIVAPTSVDYLAVLLGVLEAGAVPFLVDPALSPRQVDRLVQETGIDAVVVPSADGRGRPAGDDVPLLGGRLVLRRVRASSSSTRPDLDPSTELCRFTSGSTRTAACIEFSGTAVLAAARGWIAATGLTQDDRILCFAGAYNGLAFNTSVVPGLLVGATLVVSSTLPSAGYVRRKTAQERPTILVGFPAIYDALARSPLPLPTDGLRLCLSSAARLSPETRTILRERDGLVVADYYGLAETGPLTAGDTSGAGAGQGRVLDHAAIRVEDGQLLVRSTSMGTRYLNYPGVLESRIDADGFYRTGDEGSLDGGLLSLGGRAGKGLNIAGRKVAPDEVRDVLLRHADVRDAHVALGPAPAQDGRDREVLCALVVTADGEKDVVPALRTHAAALLAPHEVPQRYVLVDAIPRSGSGKAQLHEIDSLLV